MATVFANRGLVYAIGLSVAIVLAAPCWAQTQDSPLQVWVGEKFHVYVRFDQALDEKYVEARWRISVPAAVTASEVPQPNTEVERVDETIWSVTMALDNPELLAGVELPVLRLLAETETTESVKLQTQMVLVSDGGEIYSDDAAVDNTWFHVIARERIKWRVLIRFAGPEPVAALGTGADGAVWYRRIGRDRPIFLGRLERRRPNDAR